MELKTGFKSVIATGLGNYNNNKVVKIMKAAVTGATGFLGINLINQLLELGWQVTALHRPSSNLADLTGKNLEFVSVDFNDEQQVFEQLPEDLDVLFHLAGDTNLWSKQNARQYQANVEVSKNLAKAAAKKGVGRFVHTSSISAYGFHNSVIDESTPSTALTSGVNYLKTKYLGEQAVKQVAQETGLKTVYLNPCAIMGPYDRHNWSQLFTLIQQGTLPGVPSGEGSYCHVREVAKAHIAACEKGKVGENYILAGTDCSFLEVVTKIGKLLNKSTPKKSLPAWLLKLLGRLAYWGSLVTNKEPDMTPEKALMVTKRVVATSNKAVTELNYNDKVSIDEMLQDCFEWMQSEKLL